MANGWGVLVEHQNRLEHLYGPGCMIDCINPSIAEERAEEVIAASEIGADRNGNAPYFVSSAQVYLSRYLLGEGPATILEGTRSGDQKPWLTLAERPDVVPDEWAGTAATIEHMAPETRGAVVSTLLAALHMPR